MSRLVRYASIGDAPVDMCEAPSDPLAAFGWDLEAYTAERVEQGRQDGMRIGYDLAMADHQHLTTLVQGALLAAVAEMAQVRSIDADAVARLAMDIARTVLGHEPYDGGAALIAKVRDALGSIDDRPLRLYVHPSDAELLGEALSDVDGLGLVADPMLAPGDARVQGRWSDADLTRSAAMLAVQRALGL